MDGTITTLFILRVQTTPWKQSIVTSRKLERLASASFISMMLKDLEFGFVRNWSLSLEPTYDVLRVGILTTEPDPTFKKFIPPHSFDNYTIGYQWKKLDKDIRKVTINVKKYYVTPSNKKVTTNG